MSNFAERFRNEGRDEGRDEGIVLGIRKGMVQGEARVLLRLLERKFGTLPEKTRERIEGADEATLLTWSDRVLTAERLEDVLH